jgi:hypothetical protein
MPVPERLVRDPFRYAERPAPPVAPPPRVARVVEAPRPTPEPISPVRLVGFVRRGDNLRAVLSVRGATTVVGAGDDAEGYRVMAVDEDGVRLRTPTGDELVLKPAGR